MNSAFYGFLELPVGIRVIIVLGIILVLYSIFGGLLYNLLSIIPFILHKLVYGLYLLIEIPISVLHKSFGGICSDIAQSIAFGFSKICSLFNKFYNVLHKPKTIYKKQAFFIYLIFTTYFLMPIILDLQLNIFTLWQKSYIMYETKLVSFIESTSLLYKPLEVQVSSVNSTIPNKEKATTVDDYILPFSSIRALTEDDLKGLTKEELRLARNEIYARNGRQFREEELKTYFDSKAWYQNRTKLPLGTEPIISMLEDSNAVFIRKHE